MPFFGTKTVEVGERERDEREREKGKGEKGFFLLISKIYGNRAIGFHQSEKKS